MSLHSWLQSLRSALAPDRGRHRDPRRGSLRAATPRLNVEALEDRLTPSFSYHGTYPIGEFYSMMGHDFASATVPGSVTADFNGDGRFDLFTLSPPGASYPLGFIYLSREDGTFDEPETFDAPYNPIWIATGDFDVPYLGADGLPDFAIYYYPYDYDYPDPVVAVWRNNGDWGPDLFVSGATVTEENAGTRAATFTVTLDPASTQTISVDYATRDGDATAGSDYQAASGTLTFAPGETSKTITVLVNGDHLPEPDEAFYVVLNNSSNNADITGGVGLGTIVDDEPRISIGDVTVTEGNAGTASATFTLTLAQPSDVDVTVHYETADISAAAGSDYTATSGDVTIPAGRTSQTFTVAVEGDRLAEPNETFAVNLTGATNATIGDGQAIGSIRDDEPRISISDTTQKEGNGKKSALFTFTVTLSVAYDQAVTMSFRTANGTATTSDNDYVARTGTLTFLPGETTKTITIEVKADNKRETNEYFYLDLFGNSSNSLFTKYRGVGAILNDD